MDHIQRKHFGGTNHTLNLLASSLACKMFASFDCPYAPLALYLHNTKTEDQLNGFALNEVNRRRETNNLHTQPHYLSCQTGCLPGM
jgi:hypothetical protein